MSWWEENQPPEGQTVSNTTTPTAGTGTTTTTAPTTTAAPTYPNPAIQAIADAFKKYLGRDATEQELTQWGHDIDAQYLDKIIWAIRSSQGAIDYAAKQRANPTAATAGATTSGTAPSYVNQNDPVQKAVWDAFQKKGKTPRDQQDFQYWVDHINSTGGWADQGNQSYWLGRMAQDQGGVGDYEERPESGAAPLSGIGNAPQYQPYHLPTREEVEAMPGFQWTRDQGVKGIQRASAAHGSPLTGGVLREAADYSTGLANQYYQNAVGNSFQTSQANNAGAFNQWAGNLGAQNQFWNQGFNENMNAFYQYNTSQNSAFQQWLAMANLGHPGNPYA